MAPMRKTPYKDPRFVYLMRGSKMAVIPLQNSHGLLNGVFETPDQKILVIRYSKQGNYRAFIGNRCVGFVNNALEHRETKPSFRNRGVATELFDRAEKGKALELKEWAKTGWIPPKNVTTNTARKDTLAFLAKRGYRAPSEKDQKVLDELTKTRQPTNSPIPERIHMEKKVEATEFENPYDWHRIKVIGQHGKARGKPVWLTIRVARTQTE